MASDCCGWEAQCGRRTNINRTKNAHNTRICTCICGHLGLVPIHWHTHAHTVVWIRVEHWAYWRPQLVVAEKSVTPNSQKQQQQQPFSSPSLSPPSPPCIQPDGLGESCKLLQRGLGRSPSRNRISCILGFKMWHLVAIILMIFLIIKWPKIQDLYSPLKFLWSIALLPPIGWMPLAVVGPLKSSYGSYELPQRGPGQRLGRNRTFDVLSYCYLKCYGVKEI